MGGGRLESSSVSCDCNPGSAQRLARCVGGAHNTGRGNDGISKDTGIRGGVVFMSKLLQFCSECGLHPLVGFGMFAVDWMLFVSEAATLEATWVLSVAVAAAVTIPCILIQKYGLKEEWGLAVGKGLMVGVLTAIPTALPSVFTFAGAAMGTVALLSGNKALGDGSTS